MNIWRRLNSIDVYQSIMADLGSMAHDDGTEVANDLHRDGPGPPCTVHDREGCRQRIGGRPDPTRMVAASVTVTDDENPR